MSRERAAARLVQIVPLMPPSVSGVGDYALALARALRREHGVETSFLLSEAHRGQPHVADDFAITVIPRGNAHQLGLALSRTSADCADGVALLHFSGYGFAANGAPSWLREGISAWKDRSPGVKLITYFHELFASGRPWQKAFWYAPMQRETARGLSVLSDVRLTNRNSYADWLRKLDGGTCDVVHVLPVTSTVGELPSPPAYAARKRRLVLWARHPLLEDLLKESARVVAPLISSLELEEAVAIGAPLRETGHRLGGIPVRSAGVLGAREVSALLADSMLGAILYNPEYLAKSTLYAGFSAHAVPVVCVWQGRRGADGEDGLSAGRHYIAVTEPRPRIGEPEAEAIARNAHAWYAAHGISEHARLVAHAHQMARGGHSP